MRSYFLAKNRLPHSTTYKELIGLQVRQKYLSEGPSNAQETSRFSARLLIEVIDIWFDIWIKRKLMCSLQESPYFSILADEFENISTQEELSICGRRLVNGKLEEHFLTILHVRSTDSSTIAEDLQSLILQRQLLKKLIGQGYDGAAKFAWKIYGVHK